MSKNKIKLIIITILLLMITTGCTTYLKDSENKNVINPQTGQNLTENILCQPTDPDTIKMYTSSNIDLTHLPACSCENYTSSIYTSGTLSCKEFSITSGGYEGLWTSIFVKPLAWLILYIGKLCNSFGLGLIITSILIRLVAYPLTKKTLMQSENMKKVQPEMAKIEKKYANKDQKDKDVAMQKSQEMMMVYKKYNINPLSGCLFSFIQIPLFIAFLEAINRVPAIFEEKFLLFHLGTSPSVGIGNGNYWYIILIILVAVTTYFSFSKSMNATGGTEDAMKQTKMMTNVFLVMIVVMSIFMTSALGIYWCTSNLFTIVQNIIVKRSIK